MTINKRFKFLREHLDLTQQEFSSKVNVARSTISTIESGGSVPGKRLISDVCEQFSVNREWLVKGIGEMFKEDEIKDVELAFLLGKLSANNNSFKKRFITTMLQLDDSEWVVVEKLLQNLITRKDRVNP